MSVHAYTEDLGAITRKLVLDVPPQTIDAIDRIAEIANLAEASSDDPRGQVIQNALRVYRWALDEQLKGREIRSVDKENPSRVTRLALLIRRELTKHKHFRR